MDVQLLGLIALFAGVLILGTKQHRRAWPGQPGWQYQRVFSTGFAGLLFLVAGLIGWDLRYSHGWFQGTKLVDGPVWWQVGIGAGLLALAVFWARRVPPPIRVNQRVTR
jgi:hypothetical protein